MRPNLRRSFVVKGIVQGVGFRPFVYGLARKYGLKGWVKNSSAGVYIEVEGTPKAIEQFTEQLPLQAPPRSRIESLKFEDLPPAGFSTFEIRGKPGGRGAVSADFPRHCHLSRPAARRFSLPKTGVTGILLPTARTADPGLRSSRISPMIAPKRPWPSSACAPSARRNTTIRSIGGSMPSPMPARYAGPVWSSATARGLLFRRKILSGPPSPFCGTEKSSRSRGWADFSWPAMPGMKPRFKNCAGAKSGRTSHLP